MDTHVADRPEIQVTDPEEGHPLDDPGAGRLGGHRRLDEPERLSSGPRPEPLRRRRNGLMITTCSVAILAAAGGVFWISPYNHYKFADASAPAARARDAALSTMTGPPAPIAPAAKLARAPEPTRTPAPYHPPARIGSAAKAGGDDMAEFLRLGGQTAPAGSQTTLLGRQTAPAPSLATPPAPMANATIVAPGPISGPVTPRLTPALQPARQHAAAQTKPGPIRHTVKARAPLQAAAVPARPATVTPAGSDPVAKIAALQAAPMTEADQVQVLQLVTELGTLVRDQRVEIAQLRSDQQNLARRVDGSLADFGRRISLAEARGAVNAAMGVDSHPAQASNPSSAGSPHAGVTQAVARTAVRSPTVSGGKAVHRYHVQAASPGLAMLSELDASGAEERQLPVSPGDEVPGWGKVISIAQRGTSWVVKTDHGLIQ